MSPGDVAFCALLVPGVLVVAIPIALGRLRRRAPRPTQLAAWAFFFVLALHTLGTAYLLLRECALELARHVWLPQGLDAVPMEDVLAILFVPFVVGAAWLASRVVLDQR